MKNGKRFAVSAVAVVLVLSCAGCSLGDLGVLISNPDAVQAVIADWAPYVDVLRDWVLTP